MVLIADLKTYVYTVAQGCIDAYITGVITCSNLLFFLQSFCIVPWLLRERSVLWSLSQRPLSTEATLSNKATNLWRYYKQQCILLLPLTKGHLSNVATISCQIGWPYLRGTTVIQFYTCLANERFLMAEGDQCSYLYNFQRQIQIVKYL